MATAGMTRTVKQPKQAGYPRRASQQWIRPTEDYIPLVQQLATRLCWQLSQGAELKEDVIQAGMVGLLEAEENYLPNGKRSLADYAYSRIRWAMLRYLQSLTWTSPALRACHRQATAAQDSLASLLGRQPAAEDLARELGIPLQHYWRKEQQISQARLTSLEALPGDPGAWCQQAFQDSLPLTLQNPAVIVEKKARWEQVTAALAQLPKRQQRLVRLYYLKEYTLAEVAQRCRLAESEVHRQLGQAISQLQQALAVPASQAQVARQQCQDEQGVLFDLVVLRKNTRGVISVDEGVKRLRARRRLGRRWQPTLRYYQQQQRQQAVGTRG